MKDQTYFDWKKLNLRTFGITCFAFAITVAAYRPLSRQEQMDLEDKLNEHVEPLRKNITECGRQVRAKTDDVDRFLRRLPQSSIQGKCLVACVLKRSGLIDRNAIQKEHLMNVNRLIYGEDSEVVRQMDIASEDCMKQVDDVFEICEMASTFNDCMHLRMEHVLDKVTMERRMEALGQLGEEDDHIIDDEDDLMKLIHEEL